MIHLIFLITILWILSPKIDIWVHLHLMLKIEIIIRI